MCMSRVLIALFLGVSALGWAQPEDFTKVAKEATPAVVSIQVKSKSSSSFSTQDPFGEDIFERFFGFKRGPQAEEVQVAQASGFLVSKDGYILTNNHVVKERQEITVLLNDGREFAGKVIGEDQNTDLAIVKIEGDAFPFLALGDSDKLEVGQWVIAIGNPLGLQATLTVGVVSAKGRNNLDLAKIEDFIQTDAAINMGNSGGPLLDMEGKVIGINTAIATQTKGYMGIGFAIPSNMAKVVMEQLIQNGSVERGFLGVILQKVDQDLAQAFDLKKAEGALIADVQKGSAAEKAGLKQGDIILKYNGRSIENYAALRNAVAMMKPKTKLTLMVLRDRKMLEIPIEIGAYQESLASAENSLGIKVESEEGTLRVTQVDPKGAAAMIGLKKGAEILSVNKQKVSSAEEFYTLLNESDKSRPLLLLVKQGGLVQFVSIKVAPN